jgi:hypothetical protein
MRWALLEPVQPVSALLATGEEAPQRVAAAMTGKSALLRVLPFAYGADWAAIFATPTDEAGVEEERLLPHLPGMMPLYEAAAGIWLPVGIAPAVPDHAKSAVLLGMLDQNEIAPPVILVPRRPGKEDAAADAYLIGETHAFDHSPFESDAVGYAA